MILPTRDGDVHQIAAPASTSGPWQSLGSTWTLSDNHVTPEGAMALTSVYAAVSMIAQACGTMPLQIIDDAKQGDAKIVSSGTTARMLGAAPNPDMTSVDLWTYVFVCLLLRGNAFLVKIPAPGAKWTQMIYPLEPSTVTVWRSASGEKLFRVRVRNGDRFVEADYTKTQILHVKGLSVDDPLVGASPITLLRNRMGAQLAQADHQARSYKHGLQLKGILTTPQSTLNPTSVANMKTQWKSALADDDQIAFLHSGMQFQTVTMSLADAQFIQTIKWGHTETALAFNLPPSRLAGDSGDSSRYANMAQDDLYMYKQALMPRLELVEAALKQDEQVFGVASSWRPRFNPDKQLRADPRERWEIHRIRREIGAASVNRVLADEDEPGIGPAGDDFTPLKSSQTSKPAGGSGDDAQ